MTRKRVVDEEYISNSRKQRSYKHNHNLLLQVLEKAYYEVKTIRTTATNFGLRKLHPEEKKKIIYRLETSFVSQQQVEDINLSSLSVLVSLSSRDLIEVAMHKIASDDDLSDEDKHWWNDYFVRCKDFLSQEFNHIKETIFKKGFQKALGSATNRLGKERRSLLDLRKQVFAAKRETEELPPDDNLQNALPEDNQAGCPMNEDEEQEVTINIVAPFEDHNPETIRIRRKESGTIEGTENVEYAGIALAAVHSVIGIKVVNIQAVVSSMMSQAGNRSKYRLVRGNAHSSLGAASTRVIDENGEKVHILEHYKKELLPQFRTSKGTKGLGASDKRADVRLLEPKCGKEACNPKPRIPPGSRIDQWRKDVARAVRRAVTTSRCSTSLAASPATASCNAVSQSTSIPKVQAVTVSKRRAKDENDNEYVYEADEGGSHYSTDEESRALAKAEQSGRTRHGAGNTQLTGDYEGAYGGDDPKEY
ncbi:uncharacterized protein FOMMEDRAFT_25646 [Fomitiporia mediterranea MF3/22]|uniref:uncharacterized protein n=1 Tax=Fomitiporia mediterranea (strain MF3/22) TaxID=694068 RepID=UPI0004408271|nr:uncharacterized protein FOMMEDRAFT_25646 [Fomitiporia mediterranea MF3/22]EJD06332.1 hypothetical protein FOMMEDRAFT_25646 [Fomitiporia mediterranea MF3/22]